MTSIPLYPRRRPLPGDDDPPCCPLPKLLETPSGLALVELQGTINFPDGIDPSGDLVDPTGEADRTISPAGPSSSAGDDESQIRGVGGIKIGRLVFPEYDAAAADRDQGTAGWMKRVYMYVGEHQLLMGEVKRLAKPVAVVSRRRGSCGGDEKDGDERGGEERENIQELEVVEIVKYKIVFAQRPEPVTVSAAAT